MKKIIVIGVILNLFLALNINSTEIEPPIVVEKSHFKYVFDNQSLVENADEILLYARQQVIKLLKDSLDYKPSVYLLDNLNDFNNLIAGKFPDWGAAAAIPEKRIIVVKSPEKFNVNKDLKELLVHEYVHLITAHKAGYREVPRWLDEGLAMYISMEWSWSDNLAMSKAAVFGNLILISEIDKVNRFNENKAQVAYATSYLAVEYLVDAYGSNAVNNLLRYIFEGKSIDSALNSAIGSNIDEFQSDLDGEFDRRFNIASLFMDTLFFWLFLAFIVVVGFFINYRRRQKYFKKWDEEEKYQSSEFEYGDSENPEQSDDSESWQS
jgi:hypothetical protein